MAVVVENHRLQVSTSSRLLYPSAYGAARLTVYRGYQLRMRQFIGRKI